MIKNGLKNFFSNLKYIFTPLGVLALGVVLGISILVPTAASAVRQLVRDVKDIAQNAHVDFAAIKDALFDRVQALDWSDPLRALRTIFRVSWVKEALHECIQPFVEEGELIAAQTERAVEDAAHRMAAGVVALVVCVVLSLIGGFVLTKFLVRRSLVKRGMKKFVSATLCNALLSAAFIVAVLLLRIVWVWGAVLFAVAALFGAGALSLWEAYWLYGKGKVPAKRVVNIKNVALLYATVLITCAAAGAVVLLIGLITNRAVALFLGVAVAEIALIVIDLNAESYVRRTVDALPCDAAGGAERSEEQAQSDGQEAK